MTTQFTKPENALRRAEELIAIGNKYEALVALQSVITSKKFRMWQQVYESIMLKYIELCVELRKGKFAKDGLHQYRATTQQVANSTALEIVVKKFLDTAEKKAKEAQSKADKIILDIEDLEEEESAESTLLSSVSGEDSKDRTDREIVTPWLKFLWETYRTVLDILRNNNKLEPLYQATAVQAFDFCLRYKRKKEFHSLSELLRTHLANIGKYSNQANAININSPESLQLHLDTRFAQLKTASELELWQESYNSIRDIHGLLAIAMSKKPPANLIALYYANLSQIFWNFENHLFHAYSVNKVFSLTKAHKKDVTDDEAKIMASSLLLATLCSPIKEIEVTDLEGNQAERYLEMATLLSLSNAPVFPKRDQLIEDLVSKNIPNYVLPELRDFFYFDGKEIQSIAILRGSETKIRIYCLSSCIETIC